MSRNRLTAAAVVVTRPLTCLAASLALAPRGAAEAPITTTAVRIVRSIGTLQPSRGARLRGRERSIAGRETAGRGRPYTGRIGRFRVA